MEEIENLMSHTTLGDTLTPEQCAAQFSQAVQNGAHEARTANGRSASANGFVIDDDKDKMPLSAILPAPETALTGWQCYRQEAIRKEMELRVKMAEHKHQLELMRNHEAAEISAEPLNEQGFRNSNTLRWPDWQYLARNDFCLKNWASKQEEFQADSAVSFAEYVSTCEERFVKNRQYFYHVIDPAYGPTMQRRRIRQVVPLGVTDQFAALLCEDGTANARWRLECCEIPSRHLNTACEQLEREIQSFNESQPGKGAHAKESDTRRKELSQALQRRGIACYSPTQHAVEFPLATKFLSRAIHDKYLTMVTSAEPDVAVVYSLPTGDVIARVAVPESMAPRGSYEVIAAICNKLHVCLFIRHKDDVAAMTNATHEQHALYYFQFDHATGGTVNERAVMRACWGLDCAAVAPYFCIERNGSADASMDRDTLFWGGSNGHCYWLQLPTIAGPISINDVQDPKRMGSFDPWPSDTDELRHAREDGVLQSRPQDQRAQMPKYVFVAPYSRHSFIVSRDNMTVMVRKPLAEFAFKMHPTKGVMMPGQEQQLKEFIDRYCVRGEAEIVLPPQPADSWHTKMDYRFMTQIGPQISAAVCGNFAVIHSGNGVVTFTTLMGPTPCTVSQRFVPTSAGIVIGKDTTESYRSIALSTGRVIVQQPNGALILFVPWNQNLVTRVSLHALQARALEESVAHHH